MSYKITLCSSSSFFDKLAVFSEELAARNHEVFSPHVWDHSQKSKDEIALVQHDLIKKHFKNIDNSDAIYVANFDKNGIKNYIGGNTFLEIGKAFDCGIPIFFMNEIPDMPYTDELRAMKPFIIGNDWNKIEEIIFNQIP